MVYREKNNTFVEVLKRHNALTTLCALMASYICVFVLRNELARGFQTRTRATLCHPLQGCRLFFGAKISRSFSLKISLRLENFPTPQKRSKVWSIKISEIIALFCFFSQCLRLPPPPPRINFFHGKISSRAHGLPHATREPQLARESIFCRTDLLGIHRGNSMSWNCEWNDGCLRSKFICWEYSLVFVHVKPFPREKIVLRWQMMIAAGWKTYMSRNIRQCQLLWAF